MFILNQLVFLSTLLISGNSLNNVNIPASKIDRHAFVDRHKIITTLLEIWVGYL